MTIDKPGRYEIVEDVEADIDGACLHVTSGDVTIDGNGYILEGDGEGTGIEISVQEDDPQDLENVTVRDVDVEGWDQGVALGDQNLDILGDVVATLDGVDVRSNGHGIHFAGATGTTLTNVTTVENGDDGMTLWETTDVEFDNVTTADNGDHGLHLWDIVHRSVFTDLTTTENGGDGISLGTDVGNNEFRDVTVADNDDYGIEFSSDYGGNTVETATVEGNAEGGLYVDATEEDLRNVTTRDNGEWQLEVGRQSGGGAAVTAEELTVGDSTTVAFDAETASLDSIPETDLPDVGDDDRPIGDGLEIEGLDERASVTLSYDRERASGEVIMVRRYRDDWRPETTVREEQADGSVTFEATDDGTYAPFDVPVIPDETSNESEA